MLNLMCNSSLMFLGFLIPLLANLAPGARGILRPASQSSGRRCGGVTFPDPGPSTALIGPELQAAF